MLELTAFAIRDTKAEAFTNAPIFTVSRGVAIRMFTTLVNDKTTDAGQHPADFTLFEVGKFNQTTGELTPRPEGILDLGNGLNYQRTA